MNQNNSNKIMNKIKRINAKSETKKTDWYENHEKILTAYWKLRKENPYVAPSLTKIAKETGLSTTAVARHYKELDLNEGISQVKKFRDEVLNAIAVKAIEGDMTAAKLYMQLVFNWTEKTESKSEVINKTLQITYVTDKDKENEKNNNSIKINDIEAEEMVSDESEMKLLKEKEIEEEKDLIKKINEEKEKRKIELNKLIEEQQKRNINNSNSEPTLGIIE